MRMIAVIVALMAAGCSLTQQSGDPTAGHVRKLLNAYEFKQECLELIGMGTAAFPVYEQILDDPNASAIEVTNIFCVLGGVNVERSRFVEHAVRRLTDPQLRLSALHLLKQIGTRYDTAPVVALMYD